MDLLRSWAIKPKMVVGHSSGEIAAAYTAGMLSQKAAITVAYFRGKLSSSINLDGKAPKGAMLAVGVSVETIQPFLYDIGLNKVTIACINSPQSVTLSGDRDAIEAIHLKAEAAGFPSRKLKIDVAYHSQQMEGIASQYLSSLAGLEVHPRNRSIGFYSSVHPDILVETDRHYWIRNLVSPVRFSDAVNSMLTSQTDRNRRIDAWIEIGPHSALSNPLKQITQNLPVESRPAYLSSITRNHDSLENMLNLGCNLFNGGWAVDLAAVNFPDDSEACQVLTDIPPYPWDHAMKHWHEGRLSRNHRRREQPPHGILGTLSDDSNELDMHWTKYLRLSELPWLKDHVVKSEVVFPAAAYLAMAMEAVSQKAAISEQLVKSYIFRDVTFKKILVIPDSSEGTEVVFTLRPFRESATALSKLWHEFEIISFGSQRKAYEHCHGLISTEQQPNFCFTAEDENLLASTCLGDLMQGNLYKEWLMDAKSAGLDLGPSFNVISGCCSRNDLTFCTMNAHGSSDLTSQLSMDQNRIIISTLDSVLQAILLGGNRTDHSLASIGLPVRLREAIISVELLSHSWRDLQARSSIKAFGARYLEGDIVLTSSGHQNRLEPLVQVNKARFAVVERESDATLKNRSLNMFWNVNWKEDVDWFSQADAKTSWQLSNVDTDEMSQKIVRERAAWFCLRKAFESLVGIELKQLASTHQRYYQWLKKKYEIGCRQQLPFQESDWMSRDVDEINRTLLVASEDTAQGKMTVRMGRAIMEVLQGKKDTLSMMLEGNLLDKYYQHNRGHDRAYLHAGRFLELASHKNPNLKVLEIGAGTGLAHSIFLVLIRNPQIKRASQIAIRSPV